MIILIEKKWCKYRFEPAFQKCLKVKLQAIFLVNQDYYFFSKVLFEIIYIYTF